MNKLFGMNNLFLFFREMKKIYKNFVKRIIDIVGSICGIIILGIPMLIIASIIKHEDRGPVIFTQKRVGQKKNGEITYFSLKKFRSMRLDTPHDVPTHLLENPDQYLLKCGKTLRKYSLDELPQMFNILKGEMSIIGPRPALWNQGDLVAEREKYGANDVKPGLTGWAQINGRDELPIELKARMDGEYTERISFLFDCKCFFRTFLAVIRHDGFVEGAPLNEQEKEELAIK